VIKHQIACFGFAFSAPPKHFLARDVVKEVRLVPLLVVSGMDLSNCEEVREASVIK
jgi:hypothetical protein